MPLRGGRANGKRHVGGDCDMSVVASGCRYTGDTGIARPGGHILNRWYVLVFLVIASWISTVSAAALVPDPAVAPSPFELGSRYWSVAVGASDDASYGWIYSTQISGSYYIVDDLAITYGATFGYIDGTRMPPGVLGGPELGMRWHFAKRGRWSTYLDALAGAVLQQHPISQDSLRFNFDLRGGGGATYGLSHAVMALGGFHWHHLSNAAVRGRAHNLGYDGPMLYLEIQHSF